ncbi:MAG: HEAT repeat domain-containing protein [Planctomycetia bacterium]|nr:HEAT repeat domain-containing protein [Planctomycetia bacterium]
MSRFSLLAILLVSLAWAVPAPAASDADWQAMAQYEYGQDFKPLLAIDGETIEAMSTPERRGACAARLAALLTDPKTTLPAKQFICFKLQVLGTPAQVPVLAAMLDDAKTAEMALAALEQIPGDASLAVLRAGLAKYQGKPLVGAINSLASRKDAGSVAALGKLADGADAEVAAAALWSLGRIGGPEALDILAARVTKAGVPTPQGLAVACLRSADRLLAEGKTDAALAIFNQMNNPGNPPPIRLAALRGLLAAAGDKRAETILQWLSGDDAMKQQLAAQQLNTLTGEAATKRLLDELPKLAAPGKILVLGALAARREKAVLPAVVAAADSDDAALKRAAITCLATVGDATVLPLLVAEISGKDADVARESLVAISGDAVDQALLDALKQASEEQRAGLVDVLRRRRSTVAVPALLAEAGKEDAAAYGPAIAALRSLATPDDVPALIDLLLATAKGARRDEIEKTVLLVCGQTEDEAARVAPVLAVLEKADEPKRCALLPVLGRLGGKKALETIEPALASDRPAVRDAAVRALCNWPDASVAGRLLDLVKTTDSPAHRTWALRAYVRVITLKSDRPEAETLAMLQEAMKLAKDDAQRQLILDRASAVRTIETLRWVAPYLDDPAVNQAACRAVADLAHQRFLRNPNKAEFDVALKKVTEISKEPEVVARAKRYMMGL